MAGTELSSESWRRQAACQGEEAVAFYPPAHSERKRDRLAREHTAKSICAACPVRTPCLEQAIATDERYGIWGGLTFDERRDLRRTA